MFTQRVMAERDFDYPEGGSLSGAGGLLAGTAAFIRNGDLSRRTDSIDCQSAFCRGGVTQCTPLAGCRRSWEVVSANAFARTPSATQVAAPSEWLALTLQTNGGEKRVKGQGVDGMGL